MSQHPWKKPLTLALLTAFLGGAGLCLAVDKPAPVPAPAPTRGASGFIATLEKTVGISPEQRDSIRGLLAEQREAMKALRAQTDKKIRAILTADQQRKFDALIAEQKVGRKSKGA